MRYPFLWFFLGALFALPAAAQWTCQTEGGEPYTVSQRVFSDTCTNSLTGEVRLPGGVSKVVPFKSNPADARKATADGRRAVLNVLADPESAKFRGLFTARDSWLCGEVNAKNTMGGYVGFKRFFALGLAGLVTFDDGGMDFLGDWAERCGGLARQ